MRVALYEIEHRRRPDRGRDRRGGEIAKEYCGADAPGFVNGILGAAVREREGVRRVSRLREISERLQAIAAELRGRRGRRRARRGAAREAAELSAEAVEEANRRMREADELGL